VPENSKVDVADECVHTKKRAVTNRNRMVLNLVKTKEIVFHRPNPKIEFILLQWARPNS